MIPFGFALLLQVKGIYGNLSKGTIKFPSKPTSICWIPGYILLVLVLVAVVGGGGEVEFPKLVFISLTKDICLPENQTCPSRFFGAWGRMGRTKAFLSWSMRGPQDPMALGRCWVATFELFSDAVHVNKWIAFNDNMAIQKSCIVEYRCLVPRKETAPRMMARGKPHQNQSKPRKSSCCTVCQVHWHPDWPYHWFRTINWYVD